jgi:8-oxo-dGTP diphosphatase
MENQRPKVGMGIYILNVKNELLCLRRKGAHGEGTWCPPGGHLEFGESFEECARKESKEESGLDINDLRIIGITNDFFPDEGKHYVTVAMCARNRGGTPNIMESDKCDAIGWFPFNKLPSPLFTSVKNFLDSDPECLCKSGLRLSECHGK